MLSDREREEMLEVARSSAVREEFRAVAAASKPPIGRPADLDQILAFLSATSRLHPAAARERVTYSRVLL